MAGGFVMPPEGKPMLTEDWYPFRRHLAIGTDGTLTRNGEVEIFDAETGVPVETRYPAAPGQPRGSGELMGPVEVVEFATVEFEARAVEVYGQSGDLAPIKMDSPEGMVAEGVRRAVGEVGVESTAADAYIDARWARKSGLPVDGTNAPGVDPTGATECAAALNAVFNANAQVGDVGAQKVVRLQGVFKIASTVVIKGHVEASNAVFNWTGPTDGTAVAIGDASAGQLTRIRVSLGQINDTTKPGVGQWSATTGLRVNNTYRSKIAFHRVNGFGTGLLMVGDGTYGNGPVVGLSYADFYLGSLENNLVNHSLQAINYDAPNYPFITENNFWGGSYSHHGGTLPAHPGMKHIVIGDPDSPGVPNNNRWWGSSLEGMAEEWVLDVHGTDNTWTDCRWEHAGTGVTLGSPVRGGSKATRSLIRGGFMSESIRVTEANAGAFIILSADRAEITTTGDGGWVFSPSGGSSPVLSVMPTGWRNLGLTKAAGWMFRLLIDGIRMKNYTDGFDRFRVDIFNRKLILGAGINATKTEVFWGAVGAGSPNGSVTANPGSIFYNYTAGGTGFGVFQKMTGTGNTGWAAVGFQPFTSNYRPSAVAAGEGGTCWDASGGRPLWSRAGAWFYAPMTAVPAGE